MVAAYVKKIKHSMLCVTGVFIRDITNTIFVTLHVNMSRMSVCCFCVFLEGGEVGLGHIFDILACTRIFFSDFDISDISR